MMFRKFISNNGTLEAELNCGRIGISKDCKIQVKEKPWYEPKEKHQIILIKKDNGYHEETVLERAETEQEAYRIKQRIEQEFEILLSSPLSSKK